MEILNKDGPEVTLQKFDIADEIFDLDYFASKIEASKT